MYYDNSFRPNIEMGGTASAEKFTWESIAGLKARPDPPPRRSDSSNRGRDVEGNDQVEAETFLLGIDRFSL